jgi:F-type H+-transporting ATPase subunit b
MPAGIKNKKVILNGLIFLAILATAGEALGTEGSLNWRPTYDMVMRWLNFGIMVALFFRYARKPLVGFLMGKAGRIEENIRRVEKEKEVIEAHVGELLKERQESLKRLQQIRENLISQGELMKKKIIDDAKKESHLLLESAKRRIEHEIVSAQESLKLEIVDRSIALAVQKLPRLMTDQDTQNSLNVYLEGIHSLPRS